MVGQADLDTRVVAQAESEASPSLGAAPPGGALRYYWYPVAWSSEVTDKPIPVRVLDQPVVLWRSNGAITAFYDLCIHRGTPLSLGWLSQDGSELICGYHGWHYGPTGACTWIPSLPPGRTIPLKARATPYRVEERYGIVWLCLEDEPRADIPRFPPEIEDPTFHHANARDGTWQCNAARFIENMMDTSHFPWVHEGIFGVRDKPIVTPTTMHPTDTGMTFEFNEPVGPLVEPNKPHVRAYELIFPFYIAFWTSQPHRPEREVSWFVCNPVSSRQTRWFNISYRNFEHPMGIEKRRELARIITDQDRHLVEAQRPEELPLDLSEELHLRGPDSVAVEYRKRLRDLGVDWQ